MTGFLCAIFRPKDGSRRKVEAEVAASSEKVRRAANRFEETVKELIDRNDNLTGRERNAKLNSPT